RRYVVGTEECFSGSGARSSSQERGVTNQGKTKALGKDAEGFRFIVVAKSPLGEGGLLNGRRRQLGLDAFAEDDVAVLYLGQDDIARFERPAKHLFRKRIFDHPLDGPPQ